MHRRYRDTQDPNAEIDKKSQKVGYFLEQFSSGSNLPRLFWEQLTVEEVPRKISEDQVISKIHSKAGALKNTIMEFPL